MITTRPAISHQQRFEVLKRDGFTCQYCGQCAPNVTLEIDHIDPLSNGGAHEMSNFITSCRACNRGKAGIPLRETADNHLAYRQALRSSNAIALPTRDRNGNLKQVYKMEAHFDRDDYMLVCRHHLAIAEKHLSEALNFQWRYEYRFEDKLQLPISATFKQFVDSEPVMS